MKGSELQKLKREILEKEKIRSDLNAADKNITKICKQYGIKSLVRGKLTPLKGRRY